MTFEEIDAALLEPGAVIYLDKTGDRLKSARKDLEDLRQQGIVRLVAESKQQLFYERQ